jgi:hypothetical protein
MPATNDADDDAQPRRPSRRRLKLLLVACGLLFGLLVAEVALRVVGYTYPVFYTTDEARGYALRPGMEGWYRKEGEGFVRINSDGLRDREHPKPKDPNALRVALLGDSYAEALQVNQEDAFWSVMERRLQDCPEFARGRTVEVINFGVSGYGTAQELITLRTRVWDYSPDVVLLAFTTNNDVTDNLRALKLTDEIPYFVLRDGRLAPDDSFRDTRAFRLRNSALNRAGRFLRDSSRVIQLLHQSHGVLKAYLSRLRERRADADDQQQPARAAADAPAQGTPNAPAQGDAAASPAQDVGIDNLIYREPSDAAWDEAWRVTEEILKTMHAEVSARGAEFVVVTLSNGAQVYPDPDARALLLKRFGARDLLYPDLRVRALGEREGFPVINLAPSLQQYADQNKVFLHGFGPQPGSGHWNQLGHRVAGELLSDRLCQAGAK